MLINKYGSEYLCEYLTVIRKVMLSKAVSVSMSVSVQETPQTHLLESPTAAPLHCVQFFPHHEIFHLSRSFVQETKKNYMIGRQLAHLFSQTVAQVGLSGQVHYHGQVATRQIPVLSLSIVTECGPDGQDSISGRGKRFFSLPLYPCLL